MSSAPEVSVIMPAYNAGRFVGEALASVRAQTFRDYEILVIDDGSTDDTAERVRSCAPDAVLLRQPNGGPARARNAGMARARGRWLAFLDADDRWEPEKLATQVAYFREHPEAGLVHHAAIGQPGFAPPASDERPRHQLCDLFHLVVHVRNSTVMVPRRVIEEVGGFDERRELYVEDWDLWLRIAARHPVGYIPRAMATWRPGGIMSSAIEKTYRGQHIVIEKSLPLCAVACAAHRRDPQGCAQAAMLRMLQDLGRDRLRVGDRAGARRALSEALALKPLAWKTQATRAAAFLPQRWLAVVYWIKDGLTRLPRAQ